MLLRTIAEYLEAENFGPEEHLDREITCAFGSDLISDILMCTKEATVLLTGLTNPQIVRLSDMIDLQGIIFVRGKKPSEELIQMALERDLPMISTSFTLYKSSGILYNAGLRSCRI
jgi:predicted transcriptional regulator